MKTAHYILLGLFITSLILTIFIHPFCVIMTTIVAAYVGYSFFTNNVEKDEAAFVLFGGKVVGIVGPGFHLIPAWFMKLEVFDRKFQIILHPGKTSHEGQEHRCGIQPMALTQKAGADTVALEMVAVFTPTLVINVVVDTNNMKNLADSGGVNEGVDLVCEVITSRLQELVGGLTLKEVIAQNTRLQQELTASLETELANKGFQIDGSVRFTDMGIPKSIAESAEEAGKTENKAHADRIAGKAAADIRVQMAEAALKEAEAKAKGELALAQARATGTKALVDALPGSAQQKAAVLMAQATGIPSLPKGLQVLLMGGDGNNASNATTASTIAAIAAATTNTKGEKKGEK